MKKISTFLWIIAVLLTTFFGFSLRNMNDQNNQSVVVFGEFDDVLRLRDELKKDIIDILKDQNEVGIGHTLIGEEELLENSNILDQAEVSPILKLSNREIGEYENLIKKFKIKYVYLDGKEVLGYPNNIDKAANMINNNNVIFIVEENLNQIGIKDKKGLNDLMNQTDYSINRMSRLSKTQLKATDSKDLFYKLVRSVVDRNIRFICVDMPTNPNFTVNQNYKQMNSAVQEFAAFVKRMNYSLDKPISKLNNQRLNLNYYFLVTLGLAITCVVYLRRLLNLDKKKSVIVYIAITIFIVYISTLGKIEVILALIASIVYSSLASLLVLRRSFVEDKRPLLKSVAIFFGSNLLGGYTVVSCLSGLNYTMGQEMFRGTKLAFLIPLVIYAISFIILYDIKLKDILDYVKKKSMFTIVLTFFVVLTIIAIYILRSGNFKILSASRLELRIREFLEYTFGVRPRTKEFLIGYPAIMLLVHFKNVKSKIIKFILGFGVTIGSISVVNSFCHVFTAINVSIVRSVNGMILGLIIGKIIMMIINSMSFSIFLQNNKLVKKIISLYNNC